VIINAIAYTGDFEDDFLTSFLTLKGVNWIICCSFFYSWGWECQEGFNWANIEIYETKSKPKWKEHRI